MLPTSGATHRNLSFFDGNLVISALKTRGFVPRTAPTTAGWQWCGASWGDWLSVWKMTPHIFLYISSWCSTISPHHWMGVREHLQETSIDISREKPWSPVEFLQKKAIHPISHHFPVIFHTFPNIFHTFRPCSNGIPTPIGEPSSLPVRHSSEAAATRRPSGPGSRGSSSGISIFPVNGELRSHWVGLAVGLRKWFPLYIKMAFMDWLDHDQSNKWHELGSCTIHGIFRREIEDRSF